MIKQAFGFRPLLLLTWVCGNPLQSSDSSILLNATDWAPNTVLLYSPTPVLVL